jgi:Flp pilus assembly protein TadG
MTRIFDLGCALRAAQSFHSDRRGNVAVLFGIAFIPIMAAVGSAVDYTHANSVKAAMQSALDATALMLSRDAAKNNDAQLDSLAKTYFADLFTRNEGKTATLDASYGGVGESSLTVTATVSVPTHFMQIFGTKELTIRSTSVVRWGNTKLRVALALDNTGSMAQANKLPSLKTATKDLLKTLQDAADKPGDVQVSIIPFSKDVNVGPKNYTASWVKWEEWDAKNGTSVTTEVCDNKGKGRGKGDCTTTKTWVPNDRKTWNGCVSDRDQDYDVQEAAPNPSKKETLFPADQYDKCPVELMPLSTNWSEMNTLVESMQANGNTNQTIGLAWAWQSLQQAPPLSAPAISDKEKTKQYIILLTDGLNTENRFTTDSAKIDDRTAKLCANIKAADIEIYTILVMEGNASLLKACASKPDMFYALTSSGQLAMVFKDIGAKLSKLRVAQ